MIVKIKKLSDEAFMPTKATEGSAAYDLYAPCDVLVRPGRQVIDMKFAIELPLGYEAKIEPRSGYSCKGFAGAAASDMEPDMQFDCDVLPGKVDSDFRNSIGVIVCNRDRQFFIRRGQRIAQLTIYSVGVADFVLSEELSDTERGMGGFGSTGK